MQKRMGKDVAPEKGSVAEAYAHGRGIVGYLHVSVNALHDFHQCQKACDLPRIGHTVSLIARLRARSKKNTICLLFNVKQTLRILVFKQR